jgi:uracil-DNA glycosylase
LIAARRQVKTPTMDEPPQDLLSDVNAVLDWWREAGVDCVFDDTPRQWIVAPQAAEPEIALVDPNSFPAVKPVAPTPAEAPPRATIGGDRANWPGQLAAFAEWWLREPSLDGGQLRGRVPPRGPQAAPLMVVVPEPEAEDSDTLLSGPQGRLLAAMVAAMGLSAEQVYVASALPRHTPIADWADVGAQGLGEVLRHHIALVRPQRLIAFGRHVSPLLAPQELESPLSQNAPAQIAASSAFFSLQGASVPLLVARDLGSLLERPVAKGNFWQHWLEWSACP